MRGPDVARVARSPPAAAVWSCVRTRGMPAVAAGVAHGTPSTMIAARKLIDREAAHTFEHGLNSLQLPDGRRRRNCIVRRSVGGAGRINRRAGAALAKADVRGRHHARRQCAISGRSRRLGERASRDPSGSSRLYERIRAASRRKADLTVTGPCLLSETAHSQPRAYASAA